MSSQWNWISPSGLIVVQDDQLSASVSSTAEAKIALKELRLVKKQLGIEKREVSAQIQLVRNQYSQMTKRRGSMMRGGGTIGKFARMGEQIQRDRQRTELANDLEPYLVSKAQLESRIGGIDQAILQLEAAMLKVELDQAPATQPLGVQENKNQRNFCDQCGASISPNSRFCTQCGSRLD